MEKKVVMIGDLEFEMKEVKMLIRKGRGVWYFVGLNGKDGKLKRFIMKSVDYWEGEESGEMEFE